MNTSQFDENKVSPTSAGSADSSGGQFAPNPYPTDGTVGLDSGGESSTDTSSSIAQLLDQVRAMSNQDRAQLINALRKESDVAYLKHTEHDIPEFAQWPEDLADPQVQIGFAGKDNPMAVIRWGEGEGEYVRAWRDRRAGRLVVVYGDDWTDEFLLDEEIRRQVGKYADSVVTRARRMHDLLAYRDEALDAEVLTESVVRED